MPDYFDILIVGNSAAGLQAIRTLRKHSRELSVAIIDREDCPAYSRVLTPYFIGGKTERSNLFIVDRDFYRDLGINTLFGRTAVGLDAEGHSLTLDDDRRIGFGQLLLATGAEARTLAVGAQHSCVLRHLADADRIEQHLSRARCIAAIGAGLVSLPLLSHAQEQTEKHLIVGSGRIFSRVVDAETAAILEERFVAAGLNLHKRDDISTITENGRLELGLTSGKTLAADLLIVGKGVTPNTLLATQAGLKVADGICIDDCCKTSHPHIYAAGDAAEGQDFVTGESTVQGNWLTAVEQGEVAALNMLGHRCHYEGSLKNNITEVFSTDVAVVGYCGDDAHSTQTSHNADCSRFRKVFLDEKQRVIGATLIGETNDSGIYYQLVKTRSPLPGRQILSGTNRHADLVRHRETV